MGIFEVHPRAAATFLLKFQSLLKPTYQFGPLDIILSSSLGRFTDGNILTRIKPVSVVK